MCDGWSTRFPFITNGAITHYQNHQHLCALHLRKWEANFFIDSLGKLKISKLYVVQFETMGKNRVLQFGKLPTEMCFAVVEEYKLCAEIFLKRLEIFIANDSESPLPVLCCAESE